MITIDNVTFTYGAEGAVASGGVREISLAVPDGQFVVLCGESGCGKTTLTRLINGLIPHFYEGALVGSVQVNGKDVSVQPLYDTAQTVASVFQNPRAQFYNIDTTSEITFGCENLGLPEETILEGLSAVTASFHLENLLDRNIFHLSGGERQRIACAGAAMMEPQVLVLDEPSANLDAESIEDLRQILCAWKAAGRTIVISEHRLYYLRDLADRYVYMQNGQIAGDYTAEEFRALTAEQRSEMGLRALEAEEMEMPAAESNAMPHTSVTASADSILPSPAVATADAVLHYTGAASVDETSSLPYCDSLELRGFQFAYRHASETLHITDRAIPAHAITAIVGRNGAGKSTFARCLCGLEKCGDIVWNGRMLRAGDRLNTCYMVFQEAAHQLFTESVLDEVLISMDEEDTARAEDILTGLDLLDLRTRHPQSLSGGQQQRVAIATAIAAGREILVLDEPTSGLDYRHMREVATVLRQLRDQGMTIYVITHDQEFIAACCDHVLRMQDGEIVS